jgi:iron complex outermembrane receptor protein
LTFAARGSDQLLVANVGKQNIPYQAYPNARMDMVSNVADFGNVRYEKTFGWGKLESRLFYEHTQHEMNFLADKKQRGPGLEDGDMPMNTDGKNTGLLVKSDIYLSERDTLRLGGEYQRFRLDDWWPPTHMTTGMAPMAMGPGTFQNINGGRRDRTGAFAEWEATWNSRWASLVGARYDYVQMDTGNVQPYSWTNMVQAADQAAANAFNAQEHKRTDNNFDLTALSRYTISPNATIEAGYARKSRSPNLYERYTWGRGAMAMSMNGWFGDGNGYVGSIDLKPEVAHTLSVTANWHDAGKKVWNIAVTPYYTHVKDYIDADRCAVALGGACTDANLVATDRFVYLQFANHDARIYGIDLTAALPLSSGSLGKLAGRGVLGFVHGTNLDTGDSLYHMMPVNVKLAFDHRLGAWSNMLEVQLVAAKDDVQTARNELKTGGYGLVNVRTSYEWTRIRLDAGIENLFDKDYDLPLGGAYLGARNSMGGYSFGSNVPGMGRNLYVGMTINF